MINKAKSDTNGDGEWTVDDRYGFTMVEGNWSLSYIIGCKQFIMQKDENNLPVWNGLSEQYYDVYSKVAANIFSSTTNNASNALGTLTSSGSRDQTQQMFFNSNALFLVTLVGVLKNMRDAEFEVGVVPAPKYDETQQNYVSMIFQGANAFAIPVTNSDPERTGMVLNYLAARSTDTVRKTYIEQTLGFKYISDKEGQNMMDIILSTGIFDLASVHGWGNIAGTIMGNLRSGTLEISSSIASAESLLQRTMKDTIETFAEVGE